MKIAVIKIGAIQVYYYHYYYDLFYIYDVEIKNASALF